MDIQVTDLDVRYPDGTLALDRLSCTIPAGRITGLLGRNGSGKTTLLSVLGNLLPPSAGEVLIDGRPVFEDPVTAAATCLVRETADVPGTDPVEDAVRFAAALRPSFDVAHAHDILDRFAVPRGKPVDDLSRGQRSAVGIALGLGVRAPLTMLDEVYLGLDAPARYAFYDLLLEDHAAAPRTIIVSTHLIEEVGRVLEDVVLVDAGRVLRHESADDLRQLGATITGPAESVDRFVATARTADGAGLVAASVQRLGPTKATTVLGLLDERARREARGLGLDVGVVPLQDVFVHLTRETAR